MSVKTSAVVLAFAKSLSGCFNLYTMPQDRMNAAYAGREIRFAQREQLTRGVEQNRQV